jgi:hypothetical protein
MADDTTAALAREFDVACREAIAASRALRYNPTAWSAMIEQYGAVDAAKRLLVSGDIQSGFGRLVELGRPDLTLEWAVLHPRWAPLFRDQHREAARWRLRQAGVPSPH